MTEEKGGGAPERAHPRDMVLGLAPTRRSPRLRRDTILGYALILPSLTVFPQARIFTSSIVPWVAVSLLWKGLRGAWVASGRAGPRGPGSRNGTPTCRKSRRGSSAVFSKAQNA